MCVFELVVSIRTHLNVNILPETSFLLEDLCPLVTTVFELLKYMQKKNSEDMNEKNWKFVGVQVSKDNWDTHDYYTASQCRDMQLEILDYQNCAFYLKNISGEERKIRNVTNTRTLHIKKL